ncbi:MAG TPA: hypothetical protein VG188_09595 [Solirubrobacteraceae bacterium]|nr:hypothetical protein [Solirubrobacteraceae bacterium]
MLLLDTTVLIDSLRGLSAAERVRAAAAVGVGARLVTGNPKHFPMAELEVEHWPAGA